MTPFGRACAWELVLPVPVVVVLVLVAYAVGRWAR